MMLTRVLIEKGEVSPSFSVDDRIFLGEGLFETIKVVASQPCFAALHWRRLSLSAERLGIPFDLCEDAWRDNLVQQIKNDNVYNGGIKAILSGGIAPRGLVAQSQSSQLLFKTFNYQLEQDPLRLQSSSWLRDEANPIYGLKTINYLEAIVAKREALAKGFDEVLFFNQRHYATETTCANLFLIKEGALITPGLNHGVLPGITRERILLLCRIYGLPCFETDVDKAMIQEAEAVFVTNSLQGIRRVCSLDAMNFEVRHPVLQQLIDRLSEEEVKT